MPFLVPATEEVLYAVRQSPGSHELRHHLQTVKEAAASVLGALEN